MLCPLKKNYLASRSEHPGSRWNERIGENSPAIGPLECFVRNDAVAILVRRGASQYVRPSWSDDAQSERNITRVDSKNPQFFSSGVLTVG